MLNRLLAIWGDSLWSTDFASHLDRQQTLGRVISHSINSPLSAINLSTNQQDRLLAVSQIKRIIEDFCNPQRTLFSYQQTTTLLLQQIELLPSSDRVYVNFLVNREIKLHGRQALLIEAIICLLKNALNSSHQTIVGLTSQLDENQLKICVSDFGSGMTAWQQVLAFNPLFSSQGGAHGVGLPFANWVVSSKFKGKLQLLSKKDMGTMVVITMPVCK